MDVCAGYSLKQHRRAGCPASLGARPASLGARPASLGARPASLGTRPASLVPTPPIACVSYGFGSQPLDRCLLPPTSGTSLLRSTITMRLYRRSGFNYEFLIIANCEFSAATQLSNCANVALLIRFNLLPSH